MAGKRPSVTRRDFLQGPLALAGVFPLCCSTPVVPAAGIRYEGDLLIVDLRTVAELGRVGTAAAVVDSGRGLNILVARTGNRRFVALDRSCTHGGAQCAYNHRRRTVQCTSLNHAEYSLDGTLLHGRTHGNLRCYRARSRGSCLEIVLRGAS